VLPVTVYTVVLVGETTAELPVKALGFQVYEVAPFAESVALKPIQTAVGDTAELTVGFGTTIKLIVLLPTQPAELVATTVYTVVEVGDTTTLVPVKFPGFQV
jgi:hypothetical protein